MFANILTLAVLYRVDKTHAQLELTEIYIIYFMLGLITEPTCQEFIHHHMSRIRMTNKGYWVPLTAKTYIHNLRNVL